MMGGFAGGDEAGYWDVDIYPSAVDNKHKTNTGRSYITKNDSGYSIRAHAKVTLFQKFTGYTDNRPTFLSRVVRVEELYDTISFVPCACECFTLEGYEHPLESSSIYKAYKALNEVTADADIDEFFCAHKVVLTKGIPPHSGLGEEASDAAAFMHLLKEVCNLVLSNDELAKIGSTIDEDVPFFIYNPLSANVSGLGEIVEAFEEEALRFEFYTPEFRCDKDVVCQTFKEHLLENTSVSSSSAWAELDSKSTLERISDPRMLNDLYPAALLAYPDLQEKAKENWFFSGCGPTFFKLL